MTNRGKRRGAAKRRALTRVRTPSDQPPDELWRRRRAGARNIAGVRYQLRLTVAVLVRAAQGQFPATAVIPEGLEDIDTVAPEGRTRRYLQAKEIVPGSDRTLGVGDFADFMEHAIPILRADSMAAAALVTNGSFGPGLTDTGWETVAADQVDPAVVSSVADALEGVDRDELTELMRRVHLVRDDADLFVVTHDLAASRDIVPAVAQLAIDRCLGVVLDAGAAQAGMSLAASIPLTLNDLDAAVAAAVATIATANLPQATVAQVVAPLTFDSPSPIDERQFLEGVDVRPAHIAAGLDVPRPDHLNEIDEGVHDTGLVIIVGPSGAGKSALLWRTAADCAVRMRVWRVHRLRPGDVDVLVAAVKQQCPSSTFPLLVCVDDVGRPGTAGWTEAISALLEIQGVAVVGAAREEDFTIDLALRRAVLVRPTLDRTTARHIADVLQRRGVVSGMSVDEAYPRARGLLMEFLRLLLGGKRLETVVGEQAVGLEAPERHTELEIVRYITAAHTAGLDVSAETVRNRFGGAGLSAALRRLVDEHLLVGSATGRWTGLHELRSQVLASRLHDTPPPQLVSTLALVLSDADAAIGAGRLPAIVAAAGDATPLGPVLADRIARADATEAAEWLESARLADIAAHARACVETTNRLPLPATLNRYDWLSCAHLARFAGADLSILPAEFHEMASRLPGPTLTLHPAAASGLTDDEWLSRTANSDVEERARLLESLEGAVSWDSAAATTLAGDVPQDVMLAARVIASSYRGCADDAARAALIEALPSRADRLQLLPTRWPLVTHAEYDAERDAAVVRVIRPVDGGLSAETVATDIAFAVLDLLPEAAVGEVTVTRFDDEPIAIYGNTGPHSAIPRENRHPHQVTRWNRAFNDAVRREYTSDSLTARLRVQAELVELAGQVVVGAAERILIASDDRRSQRRWSTRVRQLRQDVAALRGMPSDVGLVLAPLGAEPSRSDDHAARALGFISLAMGQLADVVADTGRSVHGPALGGVAAQLRDAAAAYEAALGVGAARLAGVPDPLDPMLLPILHDAAALGLAAGVRSRSGLPSVTSRLDSETLASVAQRVREEQQGEERDLLRAALATVEGVDPADARLVSADSKPMLVIDPRRWLLPVPYDAFDEVLVTLLAVVRRGVAESLRFRVIVVPTRDGQVLNYSGTVIGSTDVFPVDAAEVRRLVTDAGLTLHLGRQLDDVTDAIGALGRAARAIDASRALADSRQACQLTEAARTELTAVLATIRTVDVPDAAEALRQVAEVVSARLDGHDQPSLAAELDDLMSGTGMGPLLTQLEVAARAAAWAD